MSNRASRMIGSAIVTAGGAVALSLGLLARASSNVYGQGGDFAGTIVLLAGGILFAIDWVWSALEDSRGRG